MRYINIAFPDHMNIIIPIQTFYYHHSTLPSSLTQKKLIQSGRIVNNPNKLYPQHTLTTIPITNHYYMMNSIIKRNMHTKRT